jgi:CRP/FNR family cyclic AMP-dependent transcriptional regulator
MATHLPTLKYADIFYGLSTEHLERIDAICSELAPEQDTVLFEENSPGGEMYIVARGSVEIQVDPAMLGLDTDTGPTTIATLRKGQVFGEVTLVDQGLRSASAKIAAGNTLLLVLKRDDLISLCEQDFELGYLVMRNIAADLAFKIRGADLMVREQLLWRPAESHEQAC